MSTNHYIVCITCHKCKDVAQGYEGEVRATESSANIINFLDKHRSHDLTFVSEHNETILPDCEEDL